MTFKCPFHRTETTLKRMSTYSKTPSPLSTFVHNVANSLPPLRGGNPSWMPPGLMQDFEKQIQGVFKDYSRTKRIIFKVNPVWPLVLSQRIREYTVIRKYQTLGISWHITSLLVSSDVTRTLTLGGVRLNLLEITWLVSCSIVTDRYLFLWLLSQIAIYSYKFSMC